MSRSSASSTGALLIVLGAVPACGAAPSETSAVPSAVQAEAAPIRFEGGVEQGIYWGVARTEIDAPLARLWEVVAREPVVVVNRRKVDEWTFSEELADDSEASYLVSHLVKSVFAVRWDLRWTWRVTAGTAAAPETIVGRFEKVSGTRFITVLEGTLTLEAMGSDRTGVRLDQRIGAPRTSDASIPEYATDLFAALRARVRGDELPAL